MGQPTENMEFMGQGRMFQILHICMLSAPGFNNNNNILYYFTMSNRIVVT